ncbi:hypothetical protein [Pseudomonas sp. 210_17 TE3656]
MLTSIPAFVMSSVGFLPVAFSPLAMGIVHFATRQWAITAKCTDKSRENQHK